MSVLIKGMEMPKSCKKCCFCFYDRKYEPMCLLLNGKRGKSDCPLVEIPPHGDLIDRDEQIERAWRLKLSTRELIEEMLKSAPTIIEAEEGE